MAAHQAPPSLGFSRQEHWSGLPFPSPMCESEREVTQSCLTLSDPMDCSLPGSSIHGIFQARVLEWGAIAFSDTHVSTPFQILLVFRLPHNIEQSSLCYTVGPCQSSTLNIAVCTCQSQAPYLSPANQSPLPSQVHSPSL